MKFTLNEFHNNITEEEMISDIQSVAKKLNRDSVTMDEYDKYGKYHPSTLTRKMGNWFEILKRAQLGVNRTPMNIPDEDLFRNLEELWVKLGKQPGWNQTRKPLSKYSADTYAKRFGTWRKALEKFVDYVNSNDDIDSVKLVMEDRATEDRRHTTPRAINWRLRFIVMRKDNFKCKSCGRSPATDPTIILHVDHIKAWANGGETVLENLQTLCSICNIGKSDIE